MGNNSDDDDSEVASHKISRGRLRGSHSRRKNSMRRQKSTAGQDHHKLTKMEKVMKNKINNMLTPE